MRLWRKDEGVTADEIAELEARTRYGRRVMLTDDHLPIMTDAILGQIKHAPPETFWDRQIYGKR